MKKLLALFLAVSMAAASCTALADNFLGVTPVTTAVPIGVMPVEQQTAEPTAAPTGYHSAELPDELVYKPITDRMVAGDTLVAQSDTGAFTEDDYSVMYMSVRTFFSGLSYFGHDDAPQVTVDELGLTATRSNGSSVTFLREGNEFYYTDYDLYDVASYAVNGGDIVNFPLYQYDSNGDVKLDENGQPLISLVTRADSSVSFTRTGSAVGASFDDYEIQVYWTENDLYVPLAVLNNLFRAGSYYQMVYLDGSMYLIPGLLPDSTVVDANGMTMADYYYSTTVGDRPAALTELTYNLLCLELDLNYGLASEHGIGDDFDQFLATVGLKEQMLDQDGQSFVRALATLTRAYFADFHSGVKKSSPYAGESYTYKPTSLPASTAAMIDACDRFEVARGASDLVTVSENEDGKTVYTLTQFYQEVGDTAYITFDSFTYLGLDYYSDDFKNNVADYIGQDNIALIYYANSQIKRDESPIRKVVLDLSNNGGGAVNSAVFVISWMLGSCNLSTTNPVTGANYTVVYQADVDLDGKITANDCLDAEKYDLYCLTSISSFSCGNLTPAILKESDKVTMLGQTSGGGTCAVRPSITADGTILNFSSNRRFCTVKNGSYYSIDQGITPDYVIRKLEHFYDREWLTEYIATLP